MLGDAVVGSCFLDACAGSGAIGIEALSRGALRVFFVESAPGALAAIEDNLTRSGLDGGELLRATWRQALPRLLARGVVLDLAYYDPPYDRPAAPEFLNDVLPLLRVGGRALIEHRRTEEVQGVAGFVLERQLRAGDSRVSVFARVSAEEPSRSVAAKAARMRAGDDG